MNEKVLAERFRIDENMAHSETSDVFRAVDLQNNAPVVVKVLQPSSGAEAMSFCGDVYRNFASCVV